MMTSLRGRVFRGRGPGGRRLAPLLFAIALVLPVAAQRTGSGGINTPEQRDKPYVILISLDGFKADYLDLFDLPNLRRLAARGARARWMQPVFPSLTFPNHFSLVTGLESARHGIVSNRFYDPVRKQQYVYTDSAIVSDGSWYQGEPIWVTAERQGMVAACYFWPGSEAEIGGVRPTIYKQYSSDVPNESRVATVLEWLRLPADRRPHMVTLYFSELDTAQHAGPVDAASVEQAAKALDQAMGLLVDGLDALPHGKQVYLILTSDHGMVETTQKQAVQLASVLDPVDLADIEASFAGPVANLHVRGSAERVRQIRDRIAARLARGDVYLREDLPERLQHRSNPRSGNVIIVMDEGWTMSVPRAAASEAPRASAEKPAAPRPPRPDRWGAHGWDPAVPSMRAFFVAVGPAIRAGVTIEPVRNVDVYPLLTELLGLRPAGDIDGRSGAIRDLIQQPAPQIAR
jgi:predicted AlkP superfamily pyrophosphatase or phosphodiesterase